MARRNAIQTVQQLYEDFAAIPDVVRGRTTQRSASMITHYNTGEEERMKQKQGMSAAEAKTAEMDAAYDPTMDETNGGRHSRIGMNFMAIGPDALARMALILEQGARAHNDPDGTNWRRIPIEVHLNHLAYHLNAWQRGVVGEDHLGHMLCRAMMACETEGGGQWRS